MKDILGEKVQSAALPEVCPEAAVTRYSSSKLVYNGVLKDLNSVEILSYNV